jgi:hypothetical protein
MRAQMRTEKVGLTAPRFPSAHAGNLHANYLSQAVCEVVLIYMVALHAVHTHFTTASAGMVAAVAVLT